MTNVRWWLSAYFHLLTLPIRGVFHLLRFFPRWFEKNTYSFRLVFVIPALVRVVSWLLIEVKDGDWLWYLNNVGSIPNDHPFTYFFINVIYYFYDYRWRSVLIAEIIAYCLLIVFVYLLMVELSKHWAVSLNHNMVYISGIVSFALGGAWYIYDGSPIKATLGLAFFFGFFYFLIRKYKRPKLNYFRIWCLCLFFVLSILTHVVSTYLVAGLFLVWLFKDFSQWDLWENVVRLFVANILCVTLLMISMNDLFSYSNSKIVNLNIFSFSVFWANIEKLCSSVLALYVVIFFIGLSVAIIFKETKVYNMPKQSVFDWIDFFVFGITSFLLFCSVPYTEFTFYRFMAIVPFFIAIIFIRTIRRLLG